MCGVWLGLKVQLFVEVCYLSRVIYNPVTTTEGKKPFAVCSKGLYFPTVDLSLKLVEWIEVQRALGADKISLYNLEVHPNIMKAAIPPWSETSLDILSQVLEYYVQSGYLEVSSVNFPDNEPRTSPASRDDIKKQ